MTFTDVATLENAALDAAAVKPAECDVSAAAGLPFETIAIDFEGREHVPDGDTLAELTGSKTELRVTVAVRADGFDPLGDDTGYAAIPREARLILVAGNPAYLSPAERRRSVAPRLHALVDRTADPWIGTEGIEGIARSTGATQFLLLSPTTERSLRELRDAGFPGELAVYAPTVLSTDPDVVLDSLGSYVARRPAVRSALPSGAPTDSTATGAAREVLLDGCEGFGLVGTVPEVRGRVDSLRTSGADVIVGYPARGIDGLRPDG